MPAGQQVPHYGANAECEPGCLIGMFMDRFVCDFRALDCAVLYFPPGLLALCQCGRQAFTGDDYFFFREMVGGGKQMFCIIGQQMEIL